VRHHSGWGGDGRLWTARLIAGGFLLVVGACGTVPHSELTSSSPSSDAAASQAPRTTTPPSAQAPSITSAPLGTAACDSPITNNLPVVSPSGDKLPHYGYGTGPVYWTGQEPWFDGPQEAVVLVDPSVHSAVNFTLAGPAGAAAAQFGAPTTIEPSTSSAWAYTEGPFTPSVPGCWTMTATYDSSTVVVRFTVQAGTPLPG
jgi:hypothetical protein